MVNNLNIFWKFGLKTIWQILLSPVLFAIERAHRIPSKRPPLGSHPHLMTARILHFRDRENILRVAQSLGDLQYNGNRISIYPDFSAATQR